MLNLKFKSKQLTLAQRRAFDFLQSFIRKKGYSPTAAEIAKGIEIQSRGVVHRYLRAIEDAGLIRLNPRRHRNIELLLNDDNQIPLVGNIAAGKPIEAIEQKETINISDIFLGINRFALKVKGDSMIDEGILDGDVIICQQSNVAQNGQIVVALIDKNEATLKYFHLEKGGNVKLTPANRNLKPMVYAANRVFIQGIYIGLLRVND